MDASDLDALYESTNCNTLAMWQEHADTGGPIPAYYAPHKFALATGFQPPMSVEIAGLFTALHTLTHHDPRVDLQPVDGFHFTFLPLTLPLYEAHQQLPSHVEALTHAWAPYDGQSIRINELRLVALPGQLLLAGIPNPTAVAWRKAFCEAVLNTPWRNELLARHENVPLPAPFWHTTLLRYQAARMPEYLRAFFLQHRTQRYGDVAGKLQLMRINYNWTARWPVGATSA